MRSDLHCHTTLSDGYHTLPQVIQMALQNNMDYLAITDHETFRGYEYACQLAQGTPLHIIKGCELSCKDPDTGRFVHILVYLPKVMDELNALCAATTKKRQDSGFAMLQKVAQMYPIDRAAVLNAALQSECIYKTHIMHQLADQGLCPADYRQTFGQLLSPTGSCFVPIDYPSVYDVLPIAHRSGGVVVLAHPSVYKSMELAKKLAYNNMVDGIEINHPRNLPQDKQQLVTYAADNHLIITGGTDYHGHFEWDVPIGTGLTEDNMIKQIFQKAEEKQHDLFVQDKRNLF